MSVRPGAYDSSSRRARLKQLWRAADTDESHNKEGGNGADYSPFHRRSNACDRINLESGGAWKTDRRLQRPCTRLRDVFLAGLPPSNKRRPPQSGEPQRGGLAAYSVSLRLVRRLLNAADGIYLASRCDARKSGKCPLFWAAGLGSFDLTAPWDIGHEGNSPENILVVGLPREKSALRQGARQ
jgi:hypothetical protein